MMKYLLVIIICVLIIGISKPTYAQQSVSGTISDNNSEPLVGVTIIEEGTTNGTISDLSGHYALSVSNNNAVLVFSFVGFKTIRREVNSESPINVSMEEDLVELETVVVTALGFKENKDHLGYANTVVSGDAVTKAAESTLLNSLSGKSSGLSISRNSGDPGAGAYMLIRGMSTITRDAQPLIVVDGVPISKDVRNNGDGRIAQQSRLNDINPNDIASISVLKGASAAALWGTQALGGVIYIVTKSGKYNQKLKVSLKSSYSVDIINQKYPLQTKFGQGAGGLYDARARDSWGDKIADRSGGPDELDTSGEFYLDQDGKTWYPILSKNSREIYDDSNFDQVFQNGHFWENNLSLSAGNEKSTVFFSLSDLDQEGIIKNNSDYRRTTVRINGEHLLTKDITINANISYAKTSSNRIRRGASSSGLYLGLLRNPTDFDISGYRGDYYATSNAAPVSNRQRAYREPLGADDGAGYNNPLWTINEQEDIAKVDRFINNFKLTITPTEWIDLIARVGLDYYTENRDVFNTPGSAAGELSLGTYESESASNTIFNMDYIAKARKSFGKNFNGSLLVGFNYNNKKREVNGSDISNFIQFTDVASGIRDINNALPENRTVSASYGSERTVGIYSSADISAFDMFFLNGTIRSEWASTFGDNSDKPFYFPSVSLAWQFTKAIDETGPLSFGKLRASYGEVGVQPERYNTSNTFVSPTYSDLYGGELNLGLFGNGGFVPSTSRGNSDLKPERKKELEVGADLRFINDRITLNATYFDNTTEDVLLEFPVANSRGYDRIYTNAAEIKNNGIEMDLGVRIVENSDLKWQTNFIFTKVNNEITDLVGVAAVEIGGLSAANNRSIEGQPFGVIWGSRTLRDDGGNIIFDQNGFPEQDESEGIIGDPNPDWQGSFVNNINYKNFSLSVLLETYQGADIYAGTKSVLYNLGRWEGSGNEVVAPQNLLDYNGNVILAGTTFRGNIEDFGAGPVALTEAWYTGDGGFFSNGNDELYIEDGSWTRIREITLSYTLNTPWLKDKTGLSSLEFSATGRNLFLWTDFEGNDPDTNLNGVSAGRGIEYFNNPGTKSYIFTLTLNL